MALDTGCFDLHVPPISGLSIASSYQSLILGETGKGSGEGGELDSSGDCSNGDLMVAFGRACRLSNSTCSEGSILMLLAQSWSPQINAARAPSNRIHAFKTWPRLSREAEEESSQSRGCRLSLGPMRPDVRLSRRAAPCRGPHRADRTLSACFFFFFSFEAKSSTTPTQPHRTGPGCSKASSLRPSPSVA